MSKSKQCTHRYSYVQPRVSDRDHMQGTACMCGSMSLFNGEFSHEVVCAHVAWMDGRVCESAVRCRSLVLISADRDSQPNLLEQSYAFVALVHLCEIHWCFLMLKNRTNTTTVNSSAG